MDLAKISDPLCIGQPSGFNLRPNGFRPKIKNADKGFIAKGAPKTKLSPLGAHLCHITPTERLVGLAQGD